MTFNLERKHDKVSHLDYKKEAPFRYNGKRPNSPCEKRLPHKTSSKEIKIFSIKYDYCPFLVSLRLEHFFFVTASTIIYAVFQHELYSTSLPMY